MIIESGPAVRIKERYEHKNGVLLLVCCFAEGFPGGDYVCVDGYWVAQTRQTEAGLEVVVDAKGLPLLYEYTRFETAKSVYEAAKRHIERMQNANPTH